MDQHFKLSKATANESRANEASAINQHCTVEAETISKHGRSSKSHTSRRNKFSLLFFVCVFFFCAFSTYAQQSKLKIAIIDLDYSSSYNKSDAMSLTSILTTELVNRKKYAVKERSSIQKVINELKLQSAQDVSTRATEIGKLLGVQKIITGEYFTVGYYGYFFHKISLRLIDVESGSIEAAVTMDSASRKSNGKIKKGYGISDEEFARKLLDALLN